MRGIPHSPVAKKTKPPATLIAAHQPGAYRSLVVKRDSAHYLLAKKSRGKTPAF